MLKKHRNTNYLHNNHCKDCNKISSDYAIRCSSCARKEEYKDRTNVPHWKGGITIDKKTYIRNYQRNRRLKNVMFKVMDNLRTRIWHVLKDNIKSGHMIELLGCSVEQLKQYLEKQFTVGMSWSNYGKWHVDHIKPCVLFNLSLSEEQQKCFHYTNLQPLWAVDNKSKGKKYEKTISQ